MKRKLYIAILIIGLLTACGAQPTATTAPASQPTEVPATSTQAVANIPASTNTLAPTDVPAPVATETPAEQVSTSVSFANDVLPILQSRCLNCHGGNKTEKGLSIASYEAVMAGSSNGAVVNSGVADDSLLVELILNQKMPKRGPKLTPPQTQLIIDWINQGALNN